MPIYKATLAADRRCYALDHEVEAASPAEAIAKLRANVRANDMPYMQPEDGPPSNFLLIDLTDDDDALVAEDVDLEQDDPSA